MFGNTSKNNKNTKSGISHLVPRTNLQIKQQRLCNQGEFGPVRREQHNSLFLEEAGEHLENRGNTFCDFILSYMSQNSLFGYPHYLEQCRGSETEEWKMKVDVYYGAVLIFSGWENHLKRTKAEGLK